MRLGAQIGPPTRWLCVGCGQHEHVELSIGTAPVVGKTGEQSRPGAENLVGFLFRSVAGDDVDGLTLVLDGRLLIGPQVVHPGGNRRDTKVPGLKPVVVTIGDAKHRIGPGLTGRGSRGREHHDRQPGEQLRARSAAAGSLRRELVEWRRDLREHRSPNAATGNLVHDPLRCVRSRCVGFKLLLKPHADFIGLSPQPVKARALLTGLDPGVAGSKGMFGIMSNSAEPMQSARARRFCLSLLGRASEEVERAYGASFDERVGDTIDLIDHNETVVGLENLLSNLADFEVNLSIDERAELEQLIDAYQIDAGSPTRFQVIYCDHDLPDQPTVLYSEIGVDGFELRKIEEYQSGRQDLAGPGLQRGMTRLGDGPVPPIAEIVSDSQFRGHSITRAEFEAVWNAAKAAINADS